MDTRFEARYYSSVNGRSVYRQATLLTVVVALALLALWWSNRPEAPGSRGDTSGPRISVSVLALATGDTLLAGQVDMPAPATAQSALEAAGRKAHVSIGVQEFDFGILIVQIGSVASGDAGDWTYRVNDTIPHVGVHACPLHDGDRVVFHFGKTAADSL